MKKRIVTSIVLCIAMINIVVYALDFSYSCSIENTGNKKYKAIRLTPPIYNSIREDMADLILYDKTNEPMPYFINSFTESKIETKKIYEMKLVNSFVKDEYFYYDYTLKTSLNEDVTATSIELQTDREDFAKKIEVLGGYDNVNWEKVQDDIIYNIDDNMKLEITFDDVKKYTYYRFKISNNLEKISFSNCILKYNKMLQKKEYFSDSLSPDFTTEERGTATIIKIKGIRNLSLSSITLKTDSIFKRNVTFDGRASKMLYNLDFQNTKYKDLTIPLDQYRATADTVEMVIDNKDDKPIKILGVESTYMVDELIFDGSTLDGYVLRFGNNEIQTPKSYDISNYKEQILNEGYDILNIKEIKSESSKTPSKPQSDYKLIFNITILVVATAMCIIIVLKLKK
jgi:hypothetical protein